MQHGSPRTIRRGCIHRWRHCGPIRPPRRFESAPRAQPTCKAYSGAPWRPILAPTAVRSRRGRQARGASPRRPRWGRQDSGGSARPALSALTSVASRVGPRTRLAVPARVQPIHSRRSGQSPPLPPRHRLCPCAWQRPMPAPPRRTCVPACPPGSSRPLPAAVATFNRPAILPAILAAGGPRRRPPLPPSTALRSIAIFPSLAQKIAKNCTI